MLLSGGRYIKQVLLMIIIRQIVLSYLGKTGDGRTILGDVILLKIRDPIEYTNSMKKTAYFVDTHEQENLSLR